MSSVEQEWYKTNVQSKSKMCFVNESYHFKKHQAYIIFWSISQAHQVVHITPSVLLS